MYQNIEAERARKGWSRLELAEHLGISYSTLKNWMKGNTDIPASKIAEMARLFQCTTDYLLGVSKRKEDK